MQKDCVILFSFLKNYSQTHTVYADILYISVSCKWNDFTIKTDTGMVKF